jgi:hypothetical protein
MFSKRRATSVAEVHKDSWGVVLESCGEGNHAATRPPGASGVPGVMEQKTTILCMPFERPLRSPHTPEIVRKKTTLMH